jgi:hypothetical protein
VCLTENKVSKYHYVHRLVAEAFISNPEGKRCVDHIDHNRENNIITNIRWATNNQNQGNRLKGNRCTSIFKGVVWYKRHSKWNAQILVDGKRKHLGYYHDEEEAARAYDRAAIQHFGEYALTNF